MRMTNEPRIYGYARVSTDDQDLALQKAALERYGCTHIVGEHASGGTMDRDIWNMMLLPGMLRGGDTLVVWKLDRLGRSLSGLLQTIEKLDELGVNLVSITESIDTTSAMGRFFFHIMAAMAEWERAIISERTKAGIAAHKAKGGTMGRPKHIEDNPKRIKAMQRLDSAGKLRREDGSPVMIDAEVLIALNKADKDAEPIGSTQTVARWRKAGYPGLDEGDQA